MEAGAKLVPFAGWEMPVSYAGVVKEHLAVRERAGMFDVSHMGEIRTAGPQALEFLQRVLSNDVAKIAVGGAQYSCLCRHDGGILDDLFTYRLGDDEYLTVTNAANHEKDLAWFTEQAGEGEFDVIVEDAADSYAMLAVQGPQARAAVGGLAEGELAPRMKAAQVVVAGIGCLVCGTGYTGEDGVEILCPPADAPALWDALIEAGVKPCGLGARDTLRLEVCFHLYGNDMDETRNPIEAGLGWCCREGTYFIGSEPIAAARSWAPPRQTLVAFALTDRGIPRQGNSILDAEGNEIGIVTSGTHSPCLGYGVGMGYLDLRQSKPGTPITIDVRGTRRAAEVRERPLFRRET